MKIFSLTFLFRNLYYPRDIPSPLERVAWEPSNSIGSRFATFGGNTNANHEGQQQDESAVHKAYLLCPPGLRDGFRPMKMPGQSSSSAVNGVVTDPADARVPGARVTLRNVDTNVERVTVSNNDGDYLSEHQSY